jgi:hypothetical protein
MPCLNEARTLATCIGKARAYFAAAGVVGEVVVADNGSDDGSQDIARAHGARVVDVPRRGYGAALMAGITAARGRVIVMGDSDDSYDWSAIGALVEGVRAGSDLVMGNRFQGGIKPGAMSFSHRYVGNPILSLIARLVFRAPIGDFHCGMRAFTPEAFKRMRLRTPGMEFATEMVANSVLAGLKISEVPITLYPDGRDRPPHLNTVRDGWRHLRFIATYAPDQLFLGPALLSLTAGTLLVILLAAGPVTIGSVYLGIHWLALGSMLSLTGLSLLAYGTLAKLVIRRTHPTADSRLVDWVLGRFRLEHGLLVGLVMAGLGALAELGILAHFVSAGGGPAEGSVHPTIAAATLFVAGIQLCFAAFLIRLMSEEAGRTEG